MVYLLLSDLHSNEEAVRAVLGSAGPEARRRAVVLGDLVGYGASPDEVVETVRNLNPVAAVRGNHDKVVAGIESGEEFNRTAREAARINRSLLTQESLKYLEELPRGPLPVGGSFLIAHGTPLDEDEYLVDEWEAGSIFGEMEFAVCFFGHTHLPGAFVLREGKIELLVPQGPETVLSLDSNARYLINPGSVGQPRDQDPRAAYALYDDDRRQVVFRRVEYPVGRARERIRAAGLPDILGERLERGV